MVCNERFSSAKPTVQPKHWRNVLLDNIRLTWTRRPRSAGLGYGSSKSLDETKSFNPKHEVATIEATNVCIVHGVNFAFPPLRNMCQ